MAERKRPSPASRRARPARPALREQLKAVSRALRAKKKRTPVAAAPAAVSFAQLARGVQPLPDAPPRVSPAPPPAPERVSVRPRNRLWVEQSSDGVRAWAADVPARWLDALEAGRMVPRRELDLHRKSAAEARIALAAAVRDARQAGVSCLLVVCGRGQHSSGGGPVLPDVAVECLSETLAEQVLAFATAPRKWGGKGALLVRLRPAPRQRGPGSGT